MKRRNLVLAILAVVLVLGMSVGTAWSYFTDTATVDGSMTMSVKPTAEMHEDPPKPEDGTKTIRIENTSQVVSVWTRVRVYSDLNIEAAGEGWDTTGEWYTYEDVLAPGEMSNDLDIAFKLKEPYSADNTDGEQNLEGYEENIVVMYECVPVTYDASGKSEAANWN